MTITAALIVLLLIIQREGSSSCIARPDFSTSLDVTSGRKSVCTCGVHAGDHVSNDHDTSSPDQYGGSDYHDVSDDHGVTSAPANTSPLPPVSPLKAAPVSALTAVPRTSVYVVQWMSYYPTQEHARLLSEAIGVRAPPCRHARESSTPERSREPLEPREAQGPGESPGLPLFCWEQRQRTNPATEKFPSDFSTLELRTNSCSRCFCAEHRRPEVSNDHPGHCGESSARSSEAGDLGCGAKWVIQGDAGVAVDTSEGGAEAHEKYEVGYSRDSRCCSYSESDCAGCCENLDGDFFRGDMKERAMLEAFLESLRGNPLVKSVHRDQASSAPLTALHRLVKIVSE